MLTLSEKTTIVDAYYLFEVISDETKEAYYFIPTDLSTNKVRYNEFDIIEGTTVTLPLIGFYKFKVYEQASNSNLDPAGLNEVENGKLKVIETETELAEFSATQETYKVYGG